MHIGALVSSCSIVPLLSIWFITVPVWIQMDRSWRGTTTNQMDKRVTLDQEDQTPICKNMDAGSYQLSHTWD